jgi:hypothetical protein
LEEFCFGHRVTRGPIHVRLHIGPGTNYEGFYVDGLSIVDGSGTALVVGPTNPDDVETKSGWVPDGTPGFSWMTADQ